ncbi:MAG: peptidase M42 [Oceanospirillaceae bacterium]|uniref:peptidase M42 n=1 Tax=uncultured Thalassolituus sp. TaxID=285273 RepID=UPI000C5BC157|nr:peptidase M42 [uncultured Thalassolituus sp.]MAE35034.1 peptidase M42 [Oceanospirillaceae bacterium]
MLSQSFRDLLTILARAPSVVGAEHSFFRVLQRALEERGADVKWYEGVLVAQGRRPHSLMLSAHIDRHGLICTGPNEFQYAAFVSGGRSDLLGNSVSEELMQLIVDRMGDEKVFAYEPWSGMYRGRGSIRQTYVCPHRNNLIFELEGLEHVVAGTPVAFQDDLRITDDSVTGQMDNVLTAAILVYLFELGFEGTAFFTAQEEAGRSWRYLLEWFRRFGGSTNQLVVVDTSPFPDVPTAREHTLTLRHSDANAEFNEELTQQLADTCERMGITYQYKDSYIKAQNAALEAQGESPKSLGSTEMGRIISASGGLVDGTTLQIPTTGYHTMDESASVVACEAFIDVLCDLAGIQPEE